MSATASRTSTSDHAKVSETPLNTRIAALQAAATFAAGKALGNTPDIKAADVLEVAAAFERWLLGGGMGDANGA